jgi:hypothetical protein
MVGCSIVWTAVNAVLYAMGWLSVGSGSPEPPATEPQPVAIVTPAEATTPEPAKPVAVSQPAEPPRVEPPEETRARLDLQYVAAGIDPTEWPELMTKSPTDRLDWAEVARVRALTVANLMCELAEEGFTTNPTRESAATVARMMRGRNADREAVGLAPITEATIGRMELYSDGSAPLPEPKAWREGQ